MQNKRPLKNDVAKHQIKTRGKTFYETTRKINIKIYTGDE